LRQGSRQAEENRRIHIKDSSGVRKKYDFPALGEGSVNFMKIFNSLKGFQGPINAEVDFGNEIKLLKEINEALQRSLAFINRLEFET
jgi:L-ribulose-5-phosphate 3-epimerase